MINVAEIAAGVRSIKVAGEPIVADLRAASAKSDEAWDLLGPHAFNEVGREARTLAPAETLTRVDGLLAEVLEHQAAARTAIDDAFGSGTWMSEFVQADHDLTTEARRILADPRLGPDSADTARSLLASNSFLHGEFIDAIKLGRVEKLADSSMAQFVDHLDDEARAQSVRWRERFS